MRVISDTEWCAYDYPGHGEKLPGSAMSPNYSTAAIVLQVKLRFLRDEQRPFVRISPIWFRWRSTLQDLKDFDMYRLFPPA